MLYKITKVEIVNTSTGKQFKKADIFAEGATLQVSVWPDFSKYDQVIEGGEVEGQIRESGKYKNLVDGNLGSNPMQKRQNSPITRVMEKKASDIKESQERKNDAIMTSSTMRDAVQIVVAMTAYEKYDEATMADKIEHWRKWLLDNWSPSV